MKISFDKPGSQHKSRSGFNVPLPESTIGSMTNMLVDRSSPKHITIITQQDDRLTAQDSGQMEFPYEIFPESETKFFFTADEAQIEFITNSAGLAKEAIITENGKTHKPKNVED
jgi:hypothetical protein